MKKFTLNIFALAAVVGIVPASMYPVDVTKDGVTIRVSNEKDRSEILKSNDLLCFYVRIKNDTGAPIKLPKYAISSPIKASEKLLKEAISSLPKEIGMFYVRYIIASYIHMIPCIIATDLTRPHDYPFTSHLNNFCMLGVLTSPITGITWAVRSYLRQVRIESMLQEYLGRKATTIQTDKEHGFYIYVNLDQYQRSKNKNIKVKLYRTGTDQAIVCEVDTTGALQTPIA